jgi:phenylpropionate dioxygenase-like ring-hydroxylating dioxygenase large terminal subunit
VYPTRFPRNQWYVAARGAELSRELLARRILDEPVCFYRATDGNPVALVDRCIHRQMPLSMGHLHGDDVECGYHGILFGRDGAAKRIPSQAHVPPACRVKTFTTCERRGIVWIWMGDPGLADEALIPDHHWTDASGWKAVQGTLRLRGRAQLLNENLLDLSHLSFLHADSIGTETVAEVPITTDFDEREVRVTRIMEDIDSPPTFQKVMKLEGRIDRTQVASFIPPGFHTTHVSAKPAGDLTGDRLCQHKAVHCVTPETATTAHYFWFLCRDYHTDDEAVTELWEAGVQRVFRQDIEAVEAIEGIIASYEPSYPTELNMKVDAGPLRARRMIERMIELEASDRPEPRVPGAAGILEGADGPGHRS